MELSKKVKTALDETRMLILGAQILLGFELRSAFSEGFDKLPGHAKHIEALALILMTISVALMIAPGLYHRIVEGGQDSGPFYRVATTISDLALLPFGLALGLDIFVSIEHVFGTAPGIASGIAASIVALGMWYGMPRAVAQRTGERERDMTERQRNERPQTPLHVKIEQMLTEARVILPGAQALFGFQLICVLSQAFDKLPGESKIVHALSAGCVAFFSSNSPQRRPTARPNTTRSVREFEPNRLAPCTDTHAASPTAISPDTILSGSPLALVSASP